MPARSAVSSPAMTRMQLVGGLPPPPPEQNGAVTPRLSGALLQAVGSKVCLHPLVDLRSSHCTKGIPDGNEVSNDRFTNAV